MTGVWIRALGREHATACDEIVIGLPYHFANERGRRDCAAAVRRDPGLVALGEEVVASSPTCTASTKPRRSHGWPSGPTDGAKGSATR